MTNKKQGRLLSPWPQKISEKCPPEIAARRPARIGQCEYIGMSTAWSDSMWMRCTLEQAHKSEHLCMGESMSDLSHVSLDPF